MDNTKKFWAGYSIDHWIGFIEKRRAEFFESARRMLGYGAEFEYDALRYYNEAKDLYRSFIVQDHTREGIEIENFSIDQLALLEDMEDAGIPLADIVA